MKKIAIITGASSGLGAEFARQIDNRFKGIDEYWLIARRKERMDSLALSLNKPCKIFTIDLSNREEANKLSLALVKHNPDVKFLINASGFGKYDKFLSISKKENLDMIGVNCDALTNITYSVLPHMQKNSIIINIASSAAFLPQPKFSVYAATKSYVLSFTRALKSEMKYKNIRMTAVCPGPVDTEFFGLAEEKHDVMWYKKLIMADCHGVVKKALDDAVKNNDISIYKLPIQLFYILSKTIPHRFIIRIVEILNKK